MNVLKNAFFNIINYGPIKITIEGLPFYKYIIRMIKFFRNPEIETSELKNNPLRFSIFDVFNSLGLTSVIAFFLLWLIPGLIKIEVAKIFNPVYITILFLYYSLNFSIFMSFSLTTLSYTLKCDNTLIFWKSIQLVFLHCVRFYSLVLIVCAVIFLWGLNSFYLYGKIFFIDNIILRWLFLVLFIGFFFIYCHLKLLIFPIVNFLFKKKYKKMKYFFILVSLLSSIFLNWYMPEIPVKYLFDSKEFIRQFETSPYILTFPESKKERFFKDIKKLKKL